MSLRTYIKVEACRLSYEGKNKKEILKDITNRIWKARHGSPEAFYPMHRDEELGFVTLFFKYTVLFDRMYISHGICDLVKEGIKMAKWKREQEKSEVEKQEI